MAYLIEYIYYGNYLTFASTDSELLAVKAVEWLEGEYDNCFRYRPAPMPVSSLDEFQEFVGRPTPSGLEELGFKRFLKEEKGTTQ